MKRILIIDDEISSIEPIKILFESEGFECKIIDSQLGILNIIDDFNPGIIFLDVKLTDGNDGRFLCNFLKSIEKLKHIPMILISGLMDHSILNDENLSADGFLSKPINLDHALKMVHEMTIA